MIGTHRRLFTAAGPSYHQLARGQLLGTAGDTAIALALAGTLFFAVPSTQARGNIFTWLLLTVAPFAVIGPLLGRWLDHPGRGARGMLMGASLGRAALALAAMAVIDEVWLFPLAFGLLVASRIHGIARAALLPNLLAPAFSLVTANARLATVGMMGAAMAAPLAAAAIWAFGPLGAMATGVVAFLLTAFSLSSLPRSSAVKTSDRHRVPLRLPRTVRLAQLATVAVRVLHGFLLLLLAFAFKDAGGSVLDLAAVMAAAGIGYTLAALSTPYLERRLREEPMVLAGLAIEAGAAFVAGQWFGLAAAAALAAAAGFAWGTTKLAFDGLLQRMVAPRQRGAAVTRAETAFSLAWVAGAIIPTALPLPTSLGLVIAGLAALAAQVIYVGQLLVDPDRRG